MKLSCDSTWMYRVKIIYLYKSLCLYHLRLRTLGQQITITMKPLALCGTLTERRTSRTKLVSTRIRRMLFSGSSRRKSRCSRNSWKMAVVSMATPCLDILSFCKYAFKIVNSRTFRNYKGYRMFVRDEMQMVLVQLVCTCFNQDPTRSRREFQESDTWTNLTCTCHSGLVSIPPHEEIMKAVTTIVSCPSLFPIHSIY